jgi:chemotaxis response regulator CheB
MNPIVVIATSAGGLEPLNFIVFALPDPCMASIFIVWHSGQNLTLGTHHDSRRTNLDVVESGHPAD